MRSVLPDLSIRQLEYLVAVADAPTWAAAAGNVGVSPSALSQGLAELERRLGVPLFERDGRRRVFRPAATPVLEHARQVVALTGDLARWADRTRSAQSGDIRVGMVDVAAVHHYPEVLAGFLADHPDLGFHLRVAPSAELMEQLVAGTLDIVVCIAPTTPIHGVETTTVLTEALGIYRPQGTKLGPPDTWGPWVLFPEGSHTRSLITHELQALGASINVVAESHQPDVLREMVELGLGWTVLPVVQAEAEPHSLRRARILTRRELVAAIRSGAVVDPAVAALRSALVAPT